MPKMFDPRQGRLCHERSPWRGVWKPLRGAIIGPQAHTSRVLLAFNVEGYPILREGIWQVPTLQQCRKATVRTTHPDKRLMAFRSIGTKHHRTLSNGNATTQVPCCWDWLLHQMGVEAESLAIITEKNVCSFAWKSIIYRFGIPKVLISDNGKQINNDVFKYFCKQLEIKNHYSSPALPQANGQVEVTNWSLLKLIKTQLKGAKGIWPYELPSTL